MTFIAKASKDGSGPITRLGRASGYDISGRTIVVDESYVYWREDDHVNKVDKVSHELTTLPIGFDKPGGPLLATETHLVVASPNCIQISQIDKHSGATNIVTNLAPPQKLGGGTSLVQVDQTVYCATSDRIVSLELGGDVLQEVIRLTEAESNTRFGDMVALGGYLYWSWDQRAGAGQEQLGRLELGTDKREVLTSLTYGGFVSADAGRATVYAIGSQYWLPLYAYHDGKLSVLATDQYLYGSLVGDEQYLYWARTEYSFNGRSVGNELVRISKELPPE